MQPTGRAQSILVPPWTSSVLLGVVLPISVPICKVGGHPRHRGVGVRMQREQVFTEGLELGKWQ